MSFKIPVGSAYEMWGMVWGNPRHTAGQVAMLRVKRREEVRREEVRRERRGAKRVRLSRGAWA